jgi:predicted nucleic acid-binding protein
MAGRGKRIATGEVFVDAGAWIAIAVPQDAYHHAAVETYGELLRQNRRFVTTNLVIAESYIAIRRGSGHAPAMSFLAFIRESDRLLKVYADASVDRAAEEILARYKDQDFSLVDAVSFAVMRQRNILEAFSFDRHFSTAGFVLMPAGT